MDLLIGSDGRDYPPSAAAQRPAAGSCEHGAEPAGGRNTAARRSRALGMRALRRKRLRYRPTAYL